MQFNCVKTTRKTELNVCGIPLVKCTVLCVEEDRKGQFWGLRYCLSKLRSLLSFFPSGMKTHIKIAQFNWGCIAPLMPCHKNNSEYLVFCTDKTDVRKPKGSCKTFSKRQCCLLNHLFPITGSRNSEFIHSVFCLTTGPKPPPKRCLHRVRSRASSFKWEYPLLSLRSSSSFLRRISNIRRKFSDLEQKICLQTASFVTVCIALSHRQVLASHRWSQCLNPGYSMCDIWLTRGYRENVLNERSPYHVTMSYQLATQGDLILLQDCSNLWPHYYDENEEAGSISDSFPTSISM